MIGMDHIIEVFHVLTEFFLEIYDDDCEMLFSFKVKHIPLGSGDASKN